MELMHHVIESLAVLRLLRTFRNSKIQESDNVSPSLAPWYFLFKRDLHLLSFGTKEDLSAPPKAWLDHLVLPWLPPSPMGILPSPFYKFIYEVIP